MKNSKALMLTLGHNSSALYYDGKNKPIGYEEERLNGIKSSSAFPYEAISKIIYNLPDDALRGATLMISHWFNTFNMNEFPAKYFDLEYVMDLVQANGMKVELLSEDFTHHDAHMMSSKAFYEYHLGAHEGDMHYIVADGFGNNQEVLSIYRETKYRDMPELIGQLTGYHKSLGLMYQYATSYCGMKENQDEYKFLGYEAKILDTLSSEQIRSVEDTAEAFAGDFIAEYIKHGGQYNIINDRVDLKLELSFVKSVYHTMFDQVIRSVGWDRLNDVSDTRVVIGFFIQNTIEKTIVGLIKHLDIKNVCLSGGCFYNVKLNNAILKAVSGKVSVMPLAGDQGCGPGMYHHFIGGVFNFGDLCYGKRDLNRADYSNKDEFIERVVHEIERGHIVNIMHGDMEFGPRALCNTSTLALPTKENVEYINSLNKRNTVMPMAPVILDYNMSALFNDPQSIDRVVGSNQYMIMTHDLKSEVASEGHYRGIMHMYPDGSGFSGRPQVVDSGSNSIIAKILMKTKALALINTSFNTHGTPILYSLEDGKRDYKKQMDLDIEDRNYFLSYAGL